MQALNLPSVLEGGRQVASLIVDDSATAIYCVSHSFSLGSGGRRAADGVTFQNAKPPQSAPLAESGAQTKAKTSPF